MGSLNNSYFDKCFDLYEETHNVPFVYKWIIPYILLQ